jgi:hypothetical protein
MPAIARMLSQILRPVSAAGFLLRTLLVQAAPAGVEWSPPACDPENAFKTWRGDIEFTLDDIMPETYPLQTSLTLYHAELHPDPPRHGVNDEVILRKVRS